MSLTNLIEIRVQPLTDEGYPLEMRLANDPDYPRTQGVFMQLDPAELLSQLHDIEAYGALLGQALFAQNALSNPYHAATVHSQGRGEEMRLQIIIEAADLQSVAWERVRHPTDGSFLARDANTPLSRFVNTTTHTAFTPILKAKLRVLVVIASPADLVAYSLDQISSEEQEALSETLESLPQFDVDYLWTKDPHDPPTLANITQALNSGYDVIHFLCHGGLSAVGENLLYLAKEDNNTKPIKGSELVQAFSELAQPPLLCFLASCESAKGTQRKVFSSLSPQLIAQGGVGAIIGMSDKVAITTANEFASQFYTQLLLHGQVDRATSEARAFVREEWDWSVPVLFMRASSGQLLQRTRQPGPKKQVPLLPRRYIERPAVEKQINDRILAPSATSRVVNVYGLSGHGRTLVARKVAHDVGSHFPHGMLWADVSTTPPLDILWKFIEPFDTATERSSLQGAAAYLSKLAELLAGRRVLIVLDKVNDEKQVAELIPENSDMLTVVIVSSQKMHSIVNSEDAVFVPQFEPDEAVQLFRAIWQDTYLDTPDSILKQLAEKLYHTPARITFAASDILDRQIEPSDYLDRLESDDSGRDSTLETVYEGLFPDAQNVLPHMGVMSNSAWSLDALLSVSPLKRNEVETGLRQLNTRGLIESLDGNRFRTSPLVHDFARAKLEDIGGESLVKACRSLVIHHYLQLARNSLVRQRNGLINTFLQDPTQKQHFEEELPTALATFIKRQEAFEVAGLGMSPIDLVQNAFERIILAENDCSQTWATILEANELIKPDGPLEEALRWSYEQENWPLLHLFASIPGSMIELIANDSELQLDWRFGILKSTLDETVLDETTLNAVRIEDSVWNDCELVEADWLGVHVYNVVFNDVDMSNARMPGLMLLDSVMENVDATNAILSHAVFAKCTFRDFKVRKANMSNMIITDCTLEDFDARRSDLQGTTFRNCTFSNVKFNKATMTNVKFIDCNPDEAQMEDIIGQPKWS